MLVLLGPACCFSLGRSDMQPPRCYSHSRTMCFKWEFSASRVLPFPSTLYRLQEAALLMGSAKGPLEMEEESDPAKAEEASEGRAGPALQPEKSQAPRNGENGTAGPSNRPPQAEAGWRPAGEFHPRRPDDVPASSGVFRHPLGTAASGEALTSAPDPSQDPSRDPSRGLRGLPRVAPGEKEVNPAAEHYSARGASAGPGSPYSLSGSRGGVNMNPGPWSPTSGANPGLGGSPLGRSPVSGSPSQRPPLSRFSSGQSPFGGGSPRAARQAGGWQPPPADAPIVPPVRPPSPKWPAGVGGLAKPSPARAAAAASQAPKPASSSPAPSVPGFQTAKSAPAASAPGTRGRSQFHPAPRGAKEPDAKRQRLGGLQPAQSRGANGNGAGVGTGAFSPRDGAATQPGGNRGSPGSDRGGARQFAPSQNGGGRGWEGSNGRDRGPWLPGPRGRGGRGGMNGRRGRGRTGPPSRSTQGELPPIPGFPC